MTHRMTIAGVTRELPICKVTDNLYIGAFIMCGDAENDRGLRERAARPRPEGLRLSPHCRGQEHSSDPRNGTSVRREDYFVARKGLKVYLTDPLCVDVDSITTQHQQRLYARRRRRFDARQAHSDRR